MIYKSFSKFIKLYSNDHINIKVSLVIIDFCDNIMGYPIHPLSNVGVAGQYLNQLTSDNISQRYFSGQ